MKADRLDYNNKNVIIDRIFADFEGNETEEIPKLIPETIYEEQEINQLIGLQATIITMINQYLIWRDNLIGLNQKLNFYNTLNNEQKIGYYKILKIDNTSIIRIYQELVVFQNIILALKATLNLAYGQETANKLEIEIKKIQEYYSRYNEIVDDLKLLKNDEKIEAEKVILKKPIYKKDLKQFEERVKDKKLYLKSYTALTTDLISLVNVEFKNNDETKEI